MTIRMSSNDPARDYEHNRYADLIVRRNSPNQTCHQLSELPGAGRNAKLPQVKRTTFLMLLLIVALGFAAVMIAMTL